LRGSSLVSAWSRDVFHDDPALGISSHAIAAWRFRARTHDALDPRPCAPPFRVKERHALLWVPTPPTDFCNYMNDARAHPTSDQSSPRIFRSAIRRCGLCVRLRSSYEPLSKSHDLRKPPSLESSRQVNHAKPDGADHSALQARREVEASKAIALQCAACGRRIEPVVACGSGWLKR